MGERPLHLLQDTRQRETDSDSNTFPPSPLQAHMVSPGPRASPATREEEEKTGLLVCLQVLEVLEPKVREI